MDTNSNSDNSVPDKFHISSSSNSDSQSIGNRHKCPTCCISRKVFFCQFCINSGDFLHSKHPDPILPRNCNCYGHHCRFLDKKLRYQKIKELCSFCNNQYVEKIQKSLEKEKLRFEKKRKIQRIKYIEALIKDTKAGLLTLSKKRTELVKSNAVRRHILPKYDDKIRTLSDFVYDKRYDNQGRRKGLISDYEQIQKLKIEGLAKLNRYIFPILEIRPTKTSREQAISLESLETANAIADAYNTEYVHGKWVLQDSCNQEKKYMIVAPTLPANGDYSGYVEWIASFRDGLTAPSGSDNLPSKNPGYRLSAALTYTSQLVNILSYYLDLNLPHKNNYAEFCEKLLTEQQFNRRVSRLNANILYLCFLQRMDIRKITANHTLENVLNLLNPAISDIGGVGPVNVTSITRAEDVPFLPDLEPASDSESEEESSIRQEWESVPHVVSSFDANPFQIPQQPSPQQTASMAGGLVTSAAASIASMWRGWTAR